MARTFRPAVLVTVSASGLLACSGVTSKLGIHDPEEMTHNPPCCEEQPSAAATFPSAPFTVGQQLEPRDGQQRPIQHAAGNCWVDLPFAEPPTSVQPPPRQSVNCPEGILVDPAWGECDGGSISIKTMSPMFACICYVNGNPPPPPEDVSCPVTSIPALMQAASDANPIGRNPPAIPEVPKPPPIGNPPPPPT